MFNFNGVTHVIDNPQGHKPGYNYSLVGSVPVSMMDCVPATRSDIMGGRAMKYAGEYRAYKGRKWETVQEILDAAEFHGVRMCDSPTCSCRKLFNLID